MDEKKVWETPELVVFGSIDKITENGPPPKSFGGGDGAVYMSQNVTWGG